MPAFLNVFSNIFISALSRLEQAPGLLHSPGAMPFTESFKPFETESDKLISMGDGNRFHLTCLNYLNESS
jgi:hypothetical protein